MPFIRPPLLTTRTFVGGNVRVAAAQRLDRLSIVTHPTPARVKAYLFHGLDLACEVESHLRFCRACADLASDLLAEPPEGEEPGPVLGRLRVSDGLADG